MLSSFGFAGLNPLRIVESRAFDPSLYTRFELTLRLFGEGLGFDLNVVRDAGNAAEFLYLGFGKHSLKFGMHLAFEYDAAVSDNDSYNLRA